MNSIVALPIATFVPTSAPDLPERYSSNGDEVLIELFDQLQDLKLRLGLASTETSARRKDYLKAKPEMPEALRWRLDDPVGYVIRTEDGKRQLWCNTGELENCRGREFRQWAFKGSEDDYKKLHLERPEDTDGLPPVKGFEHLWESWPDTHRQKRATELLSVWDNYKRAIHEVGEATGIREANKAEDEISDQLYSVFDRMTKIQAQTPAGLRVQAIAHVLYLHDGIIKESHYEELGMIVRLLSSLSGFPIERDEEEAA
ncbi:hypothetical protein [Bradyrhizobium sp. dw_78]|uniref:hypothetical protein n=1 Tax=Bradyrhizobium sp. dw_78 TaxID=2719793 RepID=UPI001BD4C956|nr:hypothetical protein [Bradyrhizobium sp. dw_78]